MMSHVEMYRCVHFHSCDAPVCPMDPDNDERVKLDGEPRCKGFREGIRCDICGAFFKRVEIISPPVDPSEIVDYVVNDKGVFAITADGVAWRSYRVCHDCLADLRREGGGVIRLKFKYDLKEVVVEDGKVEETAEVRNVAQAVPDFGV